jgi:hypothetical protein
MREGTTWAIGTSECMHRSLRSGAHREDDSTMSELGSTGVAIAVTQSVCPTSTPRNRSVSAMFAHLLNSSTGQEKALKRHDNAFQNILYGDHTPQLVLTRVFFFDWAAGATRHRNVQSKISRLQLKGPGLPNKRHSGFPNHHKALQNSMPSAQSEHVS